MTYCKGVSEKVVSTRVLREKFSEFGAMSFQQVASYLRKQGYRKHTKSINYEGVYHNVWFKNCGKAQVNKLFREDMNRN